MTHESNNEKRVKIEMFSVEPLGNDYKFGMKQIKFTLTRWSVTLNVPLYTKWQHSYMRWMVYE